MVSNEDLFLPEIEAGKSSAPTSFGNGISASPVFPSSSSSDSKDNNGFRPFLLNFSAPLIT